MSFLAALPFLMTLVFGSAAIALVTLAEAKANHHCRRATLQLQSNLSKSLFQLFKLNPEALSLEKRKQVAQWRLGLAIASQNAALVAALKAEILYLTYEQTKLAAQQTMIMSQAELSLKTFQNNEFPAHAKRFFPRAIAVEAENKSIAPAYKTVSNFLNRQTVQLSGETAFPASTVLPIEFRRRGGTQWECGASLQKDFSLKNSRRSPWQPVLVAAKF